MPDRTRISGVPKLGWACETKVYVTLDSKIRVSSDPGSWEIKSVGA